ncbi:MAG: hypothetical protein IPH84_10840 [Bacteroidales bacterium]|nr:hypothetical protein [Bacteroidales bacterium]
MKFPLLPGSGYTSPITLTQTGGTVATTTIYARLIAGLAVGTYNSEAIACTSTGATTQNVTCNGSVSSLAPAITVGTVSAFLKHHYQHIICGKKLYRFRCQPNC